MDIRHVVVLMLENRSFDCMLGGLYPAGDGFRGLTGEEHNIWHAPDGSQHVIKVWKSTSLSSQAACIPNPDPGELFTDIDMQLRGLGPDGKASTDAVTMSGFVDNYMRQPPAGVAADPPFDPAAPMHFFDPEEVPVISQLARAFGVSDCWHASAPCQTWPNRFFAHTGTAGRFLNNLPLHVPYIMGTVFNRLDAVKRPWRVYFHDVPQAAILTRLWGDALSHFRYFEEDFASDAASGKLPAYSFIEPRYFTDTYRGLLPNDQHPPHDVGYGESLIARVYNAVRSGPGWRNTLLMITYDEHGGCYDHIVPPAATPPGDQHWDGFDFNRFGVRVPAVIISPWVRPGSVIRPPGATPFDHTTIIATLSALFGFPSLTSRDAAAPHLLEALDSDGTNDGPSTIHAPEPVPPPEHLAAAASRSPNAMQDALGSAALFLPAAAAHAAARIAAASPLKGVSSLEAAAAGIASNVKSFLGRLS